MRRVELLLVMVGRMHFLKQMKRGRQPSSVLLIEEPIRRRTKEENKDDSGRGERRVVGGNVRRKDGGKGLTSI